MQVERFELHSMPVLNSKCLWLPQAILEKFEFFPVKCRVQRALEISRMNQDTLKGKAGTAPQITLKTKVRLFS